MSYKVGDIVLFYWYNTIKVGTIKTIDGHYIVREIGTNSNFAVIYKRVISFNTELSRKLYL